MQIPYTVDERPDTGLYNAKLGVWLFLASEVMLFGALFSTYILLRTGADTWPDGASILVAGRASAPSGPMGPRALERPMGTEIAELLGPKLPKSRSQKEKMVA